MENRFLFRGKMLNRNWVCGYLAEKDGMLFIGNKASGALAYAVQPKTICQCTGLRDKNGKLIWENDIVGFWDTYSTESGLAEADCIGKVVWDDETLSFQVTNRLSAESYEVLDECSVIGNIFDNPELLEV